MADPMEIPLSPAALAVLDGLEGAGFESWFVGGYVRDALRGVAAHDIDVATRASWRQAEYALRARGLTVHETGTQFGTVTAVAGGVPIEVTTFRSDGIYRDARHPESVHFVERIESDLARRDFTVNAIAYHPQRGIRDPFGGMDDLASRTLRAVGDARERFAEDALRILRGARFASQLGFSLERDTREAMEELAESLSGIAVERVRAEVEGLILGPYARDALLRCAHVVVAAVPEIAPMVGCPQQTPYHIYDVFGHTARVVAGSPATPLSRWAALFHDSGKPAARRTDSAGRDHFKGHAGLGAEISRAALTRLKLPPRLVDDVCFLVDRHEWFLEEGGDAAMLRALRDVRGRQELIRALLDLQVADSSAKAPGVTERLDLARASHRRLDRILASGTPFAVSQLAVGGRDLLDAGWVPGPSLGRMLEELLDRVIDGSLPNDRDALLAYASANRVC